MKTMKKIFLATILTVGIASASFAQVTPASVEVYKAQSLWFNSENAAGLVITPLDRFNTLEALYDMKSGDFKSAQNGRNERELRIGTEGSTTLGKGYVWGSFNYKNTAQDSTLFNTIMLDPQMDMPYYYADPNMSFWRKQSFDMSFKASTKAFWDVLSFGITGTYNVKTGAKQIDPRCSNFKYDLDVKPGITATFGNHSIGLTLLYTHAFERVSPINANSQESQDVAVMRGLGNQTIGVIGSLSSLGTMYYNSNKIGGAFQYGFKSSEVALLLEGWHTFAVLDANQTPSKPQKMGTTIKQNIGGKGQITFGDKNLSKISLSGNYRNTDGVEYIQEIDKRYEVQQWVTIVQNIRSTYRTLNATAAYDFFRLCDKGYNWKAGLNGAFYYEKDKYIYPASSFEAKNFYAGAEVAKNFFVKKCVIAADLNAGYRKNLDGSYIYGGPMADSPYVNFFKMENELLTADYLQAGANLSFTFPVTSKMMMSVKGAYTIMKASETTLLGNVRHAVTAGVSFTF